MVVPEGKTNALCTVHTASGTCTILIILTIPMCLALAKSNHLDSPAAFNFGDSNSNTGGLVSAGIESLNPPYGQNFFHKPSGRYSDGRLIIDFLMDAMDLPFLNAYLDSIAMPSFRKGCNFAIAASTIVRATPFSISPFSFGVQVSQTKDPGKKLDKSLPMEHFFHKGLYMLDIGQNDLTSSFYSKPTLDEILALILSVLLEFETGIKKPYDEEARKFWIHKIGPIGCLPQNIDKIGTDPSKLDEQGCVSSHNQAAKQFNLQLHAVCKKLRSQFADANVTYVDIFTIKSNLIANHSQYGFEQHTMTCCGYGGPPLNYDIRIGCGQTKTLNGTSVTAKGCSDSSKYVSWDGIHYSEAANRYVSSQILTGKFSDPLPSL